MHRKFEQLDEQTTNDIINAYDTLKDDPDTVLCPALEDVYNEFFNNTWCDIEEHMEETFPDGEITEERLHIAGIDKELMPTLGDVRMVLDSLKLPYTYEGQLYNDLQLSFFK